MIYTCLHRPLYLFVSASWGSRAELSWLPRLQRLSSVAPSVLTSSTNFIDDLNLVNRLAILAFTLWRRSGITQRKETRSECKTARNYQTSYRRWGHHLRHFRSMSFLEKCFLGKCGFDGCRRHAFALENVTVTRNVSCESSSVHFLILRICCFHSKLASTHPSLHHSIHMFVSSVALTAHFFFLGTLSLQLKLSIYLHANVSMSSNLMSLKFSILHGVVVSWQATTFVIFIHSPYIVLLSLCQYAGDSK